MDLEEYDFEIEYIKGKDNVLADALSRITIDELKNMYNDVGVLAITRSMSKNQQNSSLVQNKVDQYDMRVYETLNNAYSKKTARIKTTSVLLDKSKTKILKFTINAYKAHRRIFGLRLENNISIKEILLQVQHAANQSKLKDLQISSSDAIFQMCTIEKFKEVGNEILTKISICIVKPALNVQSDSEKHALLKKFHEDPLFGGHTGKKKLLAKLRAKYYWKNMSKDIAKFVENCENCHLNKHTQHTKEKMVITQAPQNPFDVLIVDTIGPLQKTTNDFVYAVTIICDLTKYLISIPIKDKSAKSVARAIFEKCILVYGQMKSIRTDRGTEYVNELFSELCDMMKIEHKTSTAYHHQTLGSIERNHREFNRYIRQYLESTSDDWSTYLEYFTFCYNIEKHSSFDNKYSPYELVYSRSPNLPHDLLNGQIQPIYNAENFAKEAKFRLQKAHESARALLQKFKEYNKKQYDKNSNPINLEINDTVYLRKEPYGKLRTLNKKYKVVRLDGPNALISNNEGSITVHKNRLVK